MSSIPGTLYVIRDDGHFEIGPDVRIGSSNPGRSSPLKRPRAESFASSSTLRNSTPNSTDVAFKHVTRPDPDIRIIDPLTTSMESTRQNDVSTPKRFKCHMSNLGHKPTAFDIDGFEELKYGPGGIINVDDLEERFEAEFYGPASQIQARAQPIPARNLPICFPQEELDSFDIHGVCLRRGKTAEFLNGTFLKIAKIIKNTYTKEVVLRGWMLKRCSHMMGLLPKKLNEVCFMLEVELDDSRPIMEQAMVQVGLEGLVKLRHVVSTNYPHPHLGFQREGLPYDNKDDNMEYVKDYERLVVRWKFMTFYDNASEHARTNTLKYPINIRKKVLVGLDEKECTPGCFMDPSALRHEWRGHTFIRGSGRVETLSPPPELYQSPNHAYECHQCGKGFNRAEKLLEHFQNTHEDHSRRSHPRARQHRQPIEIDLAGHETSAKRNPKPMRQAHNQTEVALMPLYPENKRKNYSTYTYGDAFCGAGGTTRGAVAAALQVLWGLDLDQNAGKTWKANFPGATHYEMWAHDLVTTINANRNLLVDVLHLSPPCQVFSPVHTRVGKNDQQNFDSLFACDALVHKARPRIITLEQTFGILHPKFEAAFNSLIQIFTSYGYSVSYEIVQFQNYGLAQTRRRLIIIAACPGETLPELPRYTHSNTSRNLKPLTSVRSVLNSIPSDCPNHNIEAACGRTIKTSWDASGAVPTITCDGGTRGHPDGERGFTDRELAALQSFPHYHVFYGSAIKKQIGNAVPPLIAEILFKAIVKHLKKVDKAEQERRAQVID
ncbi:S-adenosyl-L-methionine-dependent methyltransferase [Cadophora sp. MPI-SDFR-AT-0126]|nr:S-adenosyl-L-methionine-dependent methyltransferase [Leotiomycetes sp. MPI-SDFR-AT-0126]